MNRKQIGWIPIFGFLFSLVLIPPLNGAELNVEECRIESSSQNNVSLGFPVATDRLHSRTKPKILVIPFRFTDTPNYEFSVSSREPFAIAKDQIARLSNGKSNIDFVFEKTFDTPFSIGDMKFIHDNVHSSYRKDESISTFGFVRKLIKILDAEIDFAGIDAVYLQGSSNLGVTATAEAMMFSTTSEDPWFRPIETNEGKILNVVLTDSPKNAFTVAHEILHLYGLTDLYGGSSSPSSLSIMSGHPDGLLGLEKWILGWLPDSQVTCEEFSKGVREDVTEIRIPRRKMERLHFLKLEDVKTGVFIELGRQPYGSSSFEFLAIYAVDNDERPPVKLFYSNDAAGSGTLISMKDDVVEESISTLFSGSGLSILISDVTPREVILKVIPSSRFSEVDGLLKIAKRLQISRMNQDAKLKKVTNTKCKQALQPKRKTNYKVACKPAKK